MATSTGNRRRQLRSTGDFSRDALIELVRLLARQAAREAVAQAGRSCPEDIPDLQGGARHD